MNIYLDVDGVLLANDRNAAVGTDEFLRAVLNKYPDSTYWLTTHCWRGENRAVEVLAPHLQPETVKLLGKVKPTEWGEDKTDGIDFSQDFLWLDDDLMPGEEAKLTAEGKLNSYVAVNLHQNPNQLQPLTKQYFS